MDIVLTAAIIGFALERIIQLIKPVLDWIHCPYPLASAIVGGLLAWAFGMVVFPTLPVWVSYLLIGLALSAGSGGLHDFLELLSASKEKAREE